MKKGKKAVEKRIVFLSGKKVNLVIIEEKDIQEVTKWMNDQEVVKFLTIYAPMSITTEEEWFQRISKNNTEIVLGIATKKGKLIGTIGLHCVNWKDRNATHGISIGNKKYWSGGYGTDAGMTLFRYGFEVLGLNKINSSLIGYNERSLNYHLKCGFKIVGKWKRQIFKKGKFRDQILVDLFPRNFKKAWGKYKSPK